jgi:hypothetical protein
MPERDFRIAVTLLIAASFTAPISADGTDALVRPCGSSAVQASLSESDQAAKTVEEIIAAWQEAAAELGPFEMELALYEYDKVFQTERRGEGKCWIESPEQWRWDVTPAEVDVSENEIRGHVYEVMPAEFRSIVRTPRELHMYDSRQWEWLPIVRGDFKWSFHSDNGFDHPFRWLVFPHLYADDFDSLQIQVTRPENQAGSKTSEDRVHLQIDALKPSDRRDWYRVDLLMNRETSLPSAVKVVDPSQNRETVYVLGNVRPVNKFDRDVWNPARPENGPHSRPTSPKTENCEKRTPKTKSSSNN